MDMRLLYYLLMSFYLKYSFICYLKNLFEKMIYEHKKINNQIFLMSFLKTMLISNVFGIILTYAGRIIKTNKAEISYR